MGEPDVDHISTSHVEIWSNLSVRINSAVKTSPAMAANLTGKLWEMADLVALIDAAAPKPGPRGPYGKRTQSLEA
jgi:hypothetical protein